MANLPGKQMPLTSRLVIVAAVNDDDILKQNLLASPMVAKGGVKVICERGHACAGKAYNAGLSQTDADYVIFAHQDVYLPTGWDLRLIQATETLCRTNPNWAVLGLVGLDAGGSLLGRVWDTSSDQQFGSRLTAPAPAVSIDELVIVLRRESGIRFDPDLPSFHLYAADVILTAKAQGMSTYVCDGPVIHNTVRLGQLDSGYRLAYRYIQRKWHDQLPIKTCVMPVTRFGWPLIQRWLRVAKWEMLHGKQCRQPHLEPASLARKLGYDISSGILGEKLMGASR